MKKNILFLAGSLLLSAALIAQSSADFNIHSIAFSKAKQQLLQPVPFAENDFLVDLRNEENNALLLRITNNSAEVVTITVEHLTAGQIYTNSTRDKQVALRLRFDDNTDGNYTIVVRKGKDTWRKKVQLETKEVVTRTLRIGE